MLKAQNLAKYISRYKMKHATLNRKRNGKRSGMTEQYDPGVSMNVL
jgi:hypothetical protein